MCNDIKEEDVLIKSIDIKHMSVLEYLMWKTQNKNDKSNLQKLKAEDVV